MNRILSHSHLLALVAALAAGWRTQAAEAEGFADFGKFTLPPAGGEFVQVNVSSNLIAIAARLVEKAEPDAAKMLRGVRAVRVNVLGVTPENRADLEERIKQVRTDLDTRGWECVVTARKEKDDVCVYLKTQGEEVVKGLVVTAMKDGKQAAFINVAGDIRPDQLAELGEKLKLKELEQAGRKLKQPEKRKTKRPEPAEES
jgi:hypothetical protein